MSSSDEAKRGIAVCDDCEAIRPVEIRADDEFRALGDGECNCGSNRFRLLN